MRIIPQDVKESGTRPDPSDKFAYGKYMTTIAACGDCHTPMEKGQPLMEMEFAGGMEFNFPDRSLLRSPNITPHENGLKDWDESKFINTFKKYTEMDPDNYPVKEGEFQTVMPWYVYAEMDTADLAAIFHYLKSLDPIENDPVKWTSAEG